MTHTPERLRKMVLASGMSYPQRKPITLPEVRALAGLIRVGELLNQRLAARKEELNVRAKR